MHSKAPTSWTIRSLSFLRQRIYVWGSPAGVQKIVPYEARSEFLLLSEVRAFQEPDTKPELVNNLDLVTTIEESCQARRLASSLTAAR